MNALYKNQKGVISGLSPLDIQNGKDKGLIKLTKSETEAHLNPVPTPEQIKAHRTVEIETRLQELDLQSVRPLRAKVDGSATAEDDTKLSVIELECQALRAELSEL